MSDNEAPAVKEQPEEGVPAESSQEEQPAEPDSQQEQAPDTEAQPEESQGATDQEPTVEPAAAQEDEPAAEPEAEPEVKEEPVVISPEGSPFWLSTEEVLSRGLPENEVENFKNFYFRQTHSLQAWYDKLREFAVPTEFITLSKEEIDALSAEGEASEEQGQVLTALEDRVNQAIELFGGDGALVRVNGRSAKDAILDRDEETFIAEVRDAVVNELEVEKQRANAYAIWKDQDKHPSAFKRGINSIRASFRRSRVNSAGRTTRIQEEKPKDEENKDQETPKTDETPATETETSPAEGEAPAAEGAGQETVEVDIETGGDDGAGKTEEAPKEETDVAPAEEQPRDESAAQPVQEAPAEQPSVEEIPVEQVSSEDHPAEEQCQEETEPPKDEQSEAPKDEESEAPKDEESEAPKDEESEVKEKPDDSKEEEGKAEGEIEKVNEEKPKTASPAHHKLRKGKAETLDNQIVRAFIKSTTALHRVTAGKGGIELLRRSNKIRTDLNQLKAFGGIEGIQVSLSVCRWQEQMASYPGMEFRGFVYKNELNGLSQYNDTAYYPNTDVYYNTIQAKVQEFFKSNVQEPLRELENYIIDFYVTPDKIIVVRLNPFYTAIGACLFTWNGNGKVLTQGPFQFKIIEAPMSSPEAFTSFQPFWQTMLDSVLQQRRPQRQTRSCTLL